MTTVPDTDELLIGFIDESVDALQDLPARIDEHRSSPDDSGPINAVFRAVHSIKGNAGFFGLLALKKFAHSLENTLDEIRNGRVEMKEDLQPLIVEGFDILDGMLQRVLEGNAAAELEPQERDLLDRVAKLADQCRLDDSLEEQLLREAVSLAEEIEKAGLSESEGWAQRVRDLIPTTTDAADDEEEATEESFTPDCLANERLFHKGEDVTDRLANLFRFFIEHAKGRYTNDVGDQFLVDLTNIAEWAAEVEATDFVDALKAAETDFRTIHESSFDLDESLVSLVWDRLSGALAAMRKSSEPEVDEDAADANDSDERAQEAAPSESAEKKGTPTTKSRLVRVKEEHLDGFVNDVSNLFITCERLKDLQTRMTGSTDQIEQLVDELRQINASFSSQASDLQHSVVALRRVPVRGLFAKFPRLARSIASDLNKKIEVHLEGEETEIDKSLVEDLDAPLTHMVRNVIDHAIEIPETRLARGVDETGVMWLRAELTRTHVILEIEDNGRGIDPEMLRNKAVEKGVLSESQASVLSDSEAINLIFHPGFSTAEKVTEVSGRGVGMDVVMTTLRAHDGEIFVDSKVGEGTTVRIEIPLRKAVLVVDGLMLNHQAADYVLPLEQIREIVELKPHELKTVQGRKVATIRGEPYAAISLDWVLGEPADESRSSKSRQAVLVGCADGAVCILVDCVVGQRKVVVNQFGDMMQCPDQIAGVAQLGGGHLALVLSSSGIVKSSLAAGK